MYWLEDINIDTGEELQFSQLISKTSSNKLHAT